jgi:hypothetical protein
MDFMISNNLSIAVFRSTPVAAGIHYLLLIASRCKRCDAKIGSSLKS